MRIIIVGGRDFTDYNLLRQKCDEFFKNVGPNVEVVSGRCDTGTPTFTTKEGIVVFGADGLGEKYAEERGLHVHPFPANWDKYGKAAGQLRNKEMAKFSVALVAFYDGKSKGTNGMINIAREYNLKVRVVNY